MATFVRGSWVKAVVAIAAATAVGCGSAEGPEIKDTAAASDAAADAGDVVGTDAGADAADVGSDADAAGSCTSCLNGNGVEDLSLCPKPANDYLCQAGCCVKKEVCSADSDCVAALGTPVCPDDRFLCGCDEASGLCTQTVCASDGDCKAGELCNNGGCHPKPAAADLKVVLHRKVWIARPGDKGPADALFGLQVIGAKGEADPAAVVGWKLDGAGFTIGAEVTAGAAAGEATITASVNDGKASDTAKLWNLGPVPAEAQARVTVVDEESFAKLTGKVFVVCGPAAATPTTVEVPLIAGQALLKGLQPPCDVHVVAADHDPVSVLALDPAKGNDLLLATRLRHYAELAFDGDGKPLAADTKLVHGDVVSGVITYKGQGEAGLGITSLGIGADLLLFNLDALIGPNVSRPFHKDAPALVNPEPGKPQDIPGGVTFFLGKSVIDSYVIAGPPGKHVLWSLAGRLPLSDLLSQVSAIVAAVDGGLDVGKVVGVLLPYLSGFYSQVVLDVPFADKAGAQAPADQPLTPEMPLGLTTEVVPAALPTVGAGQWADLMLVLGGAMLPDGTMIPLGLAAASDTASAEVPADGKVDGDQEEEGDQTIFLNAAPLHSGLRVGASNRVIVAAAINVGGKGKAEGGSIVFSDIGAHVASYTPDAFLPYAHGTAFKAAERTLTLQAVAGSAFYRVVLQAGEGKRWIVLAPNEAAGTQLKLPDAKAFGIDAALVDSPKRVFVGAFDLRGGPSSLAKALGDGTFLDLVRRTRRSSFLDVH